MSITIDRQTYHVSTFPTSSVHALAERGLKFILLNVVRVKVEAAKRDAETTGKPLSYADVEALKTKLRDEYVRAMREGTFA